MASRLAVAIAGSLLLAAAPRGEAPLPLDEPGFHAHVLALYDFRLHELDAAEGVRRSQQLDDFWEQVKQAGRPGVAALRAELERSDHPAYFDFDGAMLMLAASKSHEDHELAFASAKRADLAQVKELDYFRTIHAFAVEGFDTSDAAFEILARDDFQVFIPQHYLTLGQDMCLLYMLLPTDESFYLDKAEKRLFEEKSPVAQASLMTLLATSATKRGDAALERFVADPAQPAKSREKAREILKLLKQMAAEPVQGKLESYDVLKARQRRLFMPVSDEALDDWERVRVQLRQRGPG